MSRTATPAILFEPDGYMLTGPKLMGRQAAGNGFLRAATANREGDTLWAYTPTEGSAEVFNVLVRSFDPTAQTGWLRPERPDILGQIGALYLPGPNVEAAARMRLRVNPVAYSLCGITHTIASHSAMEAITGLLIAPVMPWDALICTSNAAADTVRILLEAELALLRWRLGPSVALVLPQLPVIPLGVHCTDYTVTSQQRVFARTAFDIAEDDVVALFVGRLSFHAKAHPHAMYAGLQAVALRSGKRIVLIQSGQFANESIEHAFREGSTFTSPGIRVLFVDGGTLDQFRQSWCAADIFISLSDNVQETFGLTPIEAMAAGLPAIVSDWDGYKDTIRDGVDGFRIPTWMPQSALGDMLARRYEGGGESYDRYCGLTSQTISVDMQVLIERLGDLIQNPALRQKMGESGRRRARELFDWNVIYGRYQELWTELAQMRQEARADPIQQALLALAPKASPDRMSPYRSFVQYPTALIGPSIRVSMRPGASEEAYAEMAYHPLFRFASRVLPRAALVGDLLYSLGRDEPAIEDLARRVGVDIDPVIVAVSVLAKMGLVQLRRP